MIEGERWRWQEQRYYFWAAKIVIGIAGKGSKRERQSKGLDWGYKARTTCERDVIVATNGKTNVQIKVRSLNAKDDDVEGAGERVQSSRTGSAV
jgi:hypothetical protein